MDQEKIGKLIARQRKLKGLTQAELGEMVGVGYRAVSKWETGQTMPDISIINELSTILGITSDELLTGELKLDNKENISNNKNKQIIYVILGILLVLAISTSIYFINKNKVYTYDLYSKEINQYYIEGKISFAKKSTSVIINKLIYMDNELNNIKITNYEYEIYVDKELLISYGCLACPNYFEIPTTLKDFSNNYSVNTMAYIGFNRQKAIKESIILKLMFKTEDGENLTKEIEIEIKK